MSRKDNLIWIDLEMTGLNPDENRIIEIATAVTDKELTVLAEGPVFAIFQPDDVLAGMDEWNTRQHAQSGLTERVRASQVSEREAEAPACRSRRFADLRQQHLSGQPVSDSAHAGSRRVLSLP